jgi:hypothetical protein
VFAHIDPDPQEAPAGSVRSVGFTVEHGCDGSATVQLDMRGSGTASVTPSGTPTATASSTSLQRGRSRRRRQPRALPRAGRLASIGRPADAVGWCRTPHRHHLSQRAAGPGPLVGRRHRAARRSQHLHTSRRAGHRSRLRHRAHATRPAAADGRALPANSRRRHLTSMADEHCISVRWRRCVSVFRRCEPVSLSSATWTSKETARA